MTRVSGINPEVLVWARESGGLSMNDAAQAVGLTSSAKSSAVEKLAALERGDRDPTQRQLLAMAKAYRRPLAILYLHEPPTESVPGEDFRSSNQQAPSRDNALLKAL